MTSVPILEPQAAKKFQFVGGELCLDFCNTVGGKRGVSTREYLNSYAELLSWCEQAHLLTATQAAALRREAQRAPELAAAVLARGIALREAVYEIFEAVAERKLPSAPGMETLNAELARTLGRLRVRSHKAGFTWEWTSGEAALDQPLGPIARSAAEMLVANEGLSSVRRCAGDNCGWLFVDASKNHSRRWCDMRDCGNRAKVRRHRLRATGRKRGAS